MKGAGGWGGGHALVERCRRKQASEQREQYSKQEDARRGGREGGREKRREAPELIGCKEPRVDEREREREREKRL